jgi:GTP-binding protein EngB required for normal cell division
MNVASQDHRGSVLEEYAHLKLELAVVVRAVLHIAERSKGESAIQECRRLLARLAEDRFNLAVLGQFSRGKSSLMNALLGAAKLPTGILPLTSVITTVTYGESERVLLKREGWSFPQEIRLDQLAEFVTQQENPGNEKRVTLAEVQLPCELLRLGVHFVDTPGVASAIIANTRTTRQFLPEADAAILVTSFESPMTETELGFLREVREHVRKVFVVVNKLDLVSPMEGSTALKSVREIVGATLQDSDIEVFAVSAREALRAKLEASREALVHSGLPVLESALTSFLRRDKARELLFRAADRAADIAHQQELAIRISQRAVSPAEAAHLEQRLGERISSLTGELEAIIRNMRSRLVLGFPGMCKERIGLWSQEAEDQFTLGLRNWFSRAEGGIGSSDFEKFLQDASQRTLSAWLTRNREQIDHIFEELAQEDNGVVGTLAARISMTPVDLLGGDNESGGISASHTVDTGTLEFRQIGIPLTRFRHPWWSDLLPAGRLREAMVQRWLRRIPEFVRIYQTAVLSLLETAVGDWTDHLDRELVNRIESMRLQISRLLHRQPETRDLPEIESCLDRLRGLVKAVARMGPEESDGSLQVAPLGMSGRYAASTRPCPICVRIERTLFDFMARRQYELSVDESIQRQHALRSGFCPLHTWQFEAVASPQGICSAYPELLTLLAKRLRLLAQDSTSVQAIENGVRSLLPKETQCPACQLAAATEKSAAHELLRQLREDATLTQGVCAFHLRSILGAGPDLATAARLLIEEALAFESLAEDMQNYTLKHDAVRQHLATNAERKAALSGLARLVGRRNTVAPWRTE